MDDEIRGRTPTMVIVDDYFSEETMKVFREAVRTGESWSQVIIVAHPDQTELIEFAHLEGHEVHIQNELPGWDKHLTPNEASARHLMDTITHIARYSSKTMWISQIVEAMAASWTNAVALIPSHKVFHEPAPKKILFKQAPRQSFRQSMRSVNRNR